MLGGIKEVLSLLKGRKALTGKQRPLADTMLVAGAGLKRKTDLGVSFEVQLHLFIWRFTENLIQSFIHLFCLQFHPWRIWVLLVLVKGPLNYNARYRERS